MYCTTPVVSENCFNWFDFWAVLDGRLMRQEYVQTRHYEWFVSGTTASHNCRTGRGVFAHTDLPADVKSAFFRYALRTDDGECEPLARNRLETRSLKISIRSRGGRHMIRRCSRNKM